MVILLFANKDYLAQAISLYRALRSCNKKNEIFLLSDVKVNEKNKLKENDIEVLAFDFNLPFNLKNSACKLFGPLLIERDSYLLIDTDALVLSLDFLDDLMDRNSQISIVSEKQFSWRQYANKMPEVKADLEFYFPDIIEKELLQTGLLYVTREMWQEMYSRFTRMATLNLNYRGDQILINKVIYDLQNEGHHIDFLSENWFLTLRHNLRGFSSLRHKGNIDIVDSTLLYDNKKVYALHCTNSSGHVITVENYFESLGKYFIYV